MKKELERIITLFEGYLLTKDYEPDDIYICCNFSKKHSTKGRELVFTHKDKIVSKYKLNDVYFSPSSLWCIYEAKYNNELDIVLQEKIDYLKYLITTLPK